jgi:hypothetical protein
VPKPTTIKADSHRGWLVRKKIMASIHMGRL